MAEGRGSNPAWHQTARELLNLKMSELGVFTRTHYSLLFCLRPVWGRWTVWLEAVQKLFNQWTSPSCWLSKCLVFPFQLQHSSRWTRCRRSLQPSQAVQRWVSGTQGSSCCLLFLDRFETGKLYFSSLVASSLFNENSCHQIGLLEVIILTPKANFFISQRFLANPGSNLLFSPKNLSF